MSDIKIPVGRQQNIEAVWSFPCIRSLALSSLHLAPDTFHWSPEMEHACFLTMFFLSLEPSTLGDYGHSLLLVIPRTKPFIKEKVRNRANVYIYLFIFLKGQQNMNTDDVTSQNLTVISMHWETFAITPEGSKNDF